MTTALELTAPATVTIVGLVRRWVADIAACADAGDDVVDDVKLCVGEAVANAARHAYESDGLIDVTVEIDDDELVVVVRDRGKGLVDMRSAENGYGLRIIETLTRRYLISSAPNRGTEVRMIFGLAGAPLPAVARPPPAR